MRNDNYFFRVFHFLFFHKWFSQVIQMVRAAFRAIIRFLSYGPADSFAAIAAMVKGVCAMSFLAITDHNRIDAFI